MLINVAAYRNEEEIKSEDAAVIFRQLSVLNLIYTPTRLLRKSQNLFTFDWSNPSTTVGYHLTAQMFPGVYGQ